MHLPRPLIAALLCLALGPAVAQDGGGDDSGIEVSEDPKPEEQKPQDGGYDAEEQKRKNAGLAGGGQEDEGDANAPKVKADLQTRINQAIERGVAWLKQRQDKEGSWGPVKATTFYGDKSKTGDFVRDELGPTAWAVYTLAKCGVKKTDPAIDNGLKSIAKRTEFVFDVIGIKPNDPDPTTLEQKNIGKKNPRNLTTYESAAIVMMIEAVYQQSGKLTDKRAKRVLSEDPAVPPKGSKIHKDVWTKMHDRILGLTVGRSKIVIEGRSGTMNVTGQQVTSGQNVGGWRYGGGEDADLSATQFVLLAMRAASQAGYPVEKASPKMWDSVVGYVKKCQKGDGGFGYQVGGPSYASMTACGVSCLLICKEQIGLIKDKPMPPGIDEAIANGMAWLDKNFEADQNAGAPKPELFYYLYGIERVGDLSGRKEFNGKDWYTRGAMLLLERQEADGKWQDSTGFPPYDVLGTCFALLFLKRATIPVVTVSER
jgi:hypothetical protein